MPEQLILTTLTVDEFRELITSAVRSEIQAQIKSQAPVEDTELINIKTVAAMLGVSEVTIHCWKKAGKLPFQRMGRRVYFTRKGVLDAMKKIQIEPAFRKRW